MQRNGNDNNGDEDLRFRHLQNCVYKAAGGADLEAGTTSSSGSEADEKRNDKGDDVIRDEVDKPSSTGSSEVDEREEEEEQEEKAPPKIYKEKTKTYYQGLATCVTFSRDVIEPDFSVAFEALRDQLRYHIVTKIKQYHNVKIQLEASILFRRTQEEEEEEAEEKEEEEEKEQDAREKMAENNDNNVSKMFFHDVIKHLWSKPTVISLATELDDALSGTYEELSDQIENMRDMGSNFFVKDVLSFKLSIYKTTNLSKVGAFVRLPAQLKCKYVLTPINYDDKCLVWTISLHLALAERYGHLMKSSWPEQFNKKTVFNEVELMKICGHIFTSFLSNMQLKLPLLLKKKTIETFV